MTLWNRATVDGLKRTAWKSSDIVMLAKGANPADSLQAATELGYPYFSHLSRGYPIYSVIERSY